MTRLARPRCRLASIGILLLAARAPGVARAGAPDAAAELEAAAIDGNATPMLAPARIDALPPVERQAWTAYVDRSRALSARDHASMEAELRAAGKARMTRAPYRKAFRIEPEMTPAYFATPEARRAAQAMI